MKSEHVFKHIKLVLWGVAVAFIAQIFLSSTAHAQSAESTAPASEIEILRTTLVQVGAAIASSTAITDEERVALLTQLVAVSRTIVNLERTTAQNEIAARENEQEPEDVDAVLPEDIGLYRVAARIDLSSYQADITEYYFAEDYTFDDLAEEPFVVEFETVERTISLTQPTGNLSFPRLVNRLEDQVVVDLMETYGLTDDIAVDRITFASARNPLATQGVERNSASAYELMGQFGQQTIVSQVHVIPNNGQATIKIFSDQAEEILIQVTRDTFNYNEPDGEDRSLYEPEGDEYAYIYAYDSSDGVKQNFSDSEDIDEDPYEKYDVFEQIGGVEKDEIIEFINELFAEIPFTEQLREADETLFSFLIDNQVSYQARSGSYYNPNDPDDSCVDEGDRLILNEYVLQVLAGLEANYILGDLTIAYPVVVDTVEDLDARSVGCRGERSFF